MAEPAAVAKMEKISPCANAGASFSVVGNLWRLNGAWDYGPLGVELTQPQGLLVEMHDPAPRRHRRLRRLDSDERRRLESSGHVDTFSDPLVECMLTKKRYRADQIEPQSGTAYYYSGVFTKNKRSPDTTIQLTPSILSQVLRIFH